MLQNDVYSYDYRIVGRDVSDKKEFCSKSNAEDIVNSDYKHPKRVWKDLIGEYYDLHVKSNTLLLADIFESRSKCIEIYQLDLTNFLSAPGLE